MRDFSKEEMDNQFTYHPPNREQMVVYENLRGWAKGFAQKILDNVPDSWEREEAIKKINEAVFWANAGIARRSHGRKSGA